MKCVSVHLVLEYLKELEAYLFFISFFFTLDELDSSVSEQILMPKHRCKTILVVVKVLSWIY